MSEIQKLRIRYHQEIRKNIIRESQDKNNHFFFNMADGANASSVQISHHLVNKLPYPSDSSCVAGQTSGDLFEKYTKDFIENSFNIINFPRPGNWCYATTQTSISNFDQYEHLGELDRIIEENKALSTIIGSEYIIKPDITVSRMPVSDDEINLNQMIVDENVSRYSPLRASNKIKLVPILHASISCKWTIRSDRSQNTRTEALNLIRNRKGNLPHVVSVTAEPLPTRIATLALGTGDLDCVYHFALNELLESVQEVNNNDQLDLLMTMINGKRLRDISDLPLDLAI